MPTYQYRCGSCGEETEAVQAFTDAALTVCPTCGEAALRKRFGSVGVVFKGSGFYRTDSRAQSNGTSAPAKAEGTSGTGTAKPEKSTKAEPTKAKAAPTPA